MGGSVLRWMIHRAQYRQEPQTGGCNFARPFDWVTTRSQAEVIFRPSSLTSIIHFESCPAMAAQGAVVRHGASPSPRMRHCSARGSKRRLRVACTAAAEAQPAQQPSTSLAALPPEGTSALVTQPAPAEAVLATRPGKRTAVLAASKTAAQLVTERARPLEQYMTLPASQYSLLDAQRVERLDDSTFRCYVGSLQFFSLQVEPVITVQVTVEERGPTVRLLSAKVGGSGRGRRASRGGASHAALACGDKAGGHRRRCGSTSSGSPRKAAWALSILLGDPWGVWLTLTDRAGCLLLLLLLVLLWLCSCKAARSLRQSMTNSPPRC